MLSIPVNENTELRLRQQEDAEAFFAVIEKNRSYLRQWLPWLDRNQTVAGTQSFIQSNLDLYNQGEFPDLGIWHDNQWVGSIGFHGVDAQNHRAALGYWLAEECQGQGIMTACVRALVTYGFTELDLHRIEIGCAVGNAKSCAIPERLGFYKEGVRRGYEWLYDHYEDSNLFSMLKPDWEAHSPS